MNHISFFLLKSLAFSSLFFFSICIFRWRCRINSFRKFNMGRSECRFFYFTIISLSSSSSLLFFLLVMTRMIMMFIVISCLQVAEKLSKYCILLHILEGSTEASHFSAICILCLNNVSWHMKMTLSNYHNFSRDINHGVSSMAIWHSALQISYI